MITTLRYKIPEEQEELDIAQNGWRYLVAIQDFDRYLRRVADLDTQPSFEEITESFYNILEENRVNL